MKQYPLMLKFMFLSEGIASFQNYAFFQSWNVMKSDATCTSAIYQ